MAFLNESGLARLWNRVLLKLQEYATKDDIPDTSGFINVPTASVGQTIAVKTVDENGKPIEWETTNIITNEKLDTVIHEIASVSASFEDYGELGQTIQDIVGNCRIYNNDVLEITAIQTLSSKELDNGATLYLNTINFSPECEVMDGTFEPLLLECLKGNSTYRIEFFDNYNNATMLSSGYYHFGPYFFYLSENGTEGELLHVFFESERDFITEYSVMLEEYIRHKLHYLENNIPIKVSELENDTGYLTEHQDLSAYATKEELNTKVPNATASQQLVTDTNGKSKWVDRDFFEAESQIIVPNNTYGVYSGYGQSVNGEFNIPTIGETYHVIFGDIETDKTAVAGNTGVRIGEDYNEFIIEIQNETTMYIETANTGPKIIEIKKDGVLKPLDEKFIPDTIARTSAIPTVPSKVSELTNDAGYTKSSDVIPIPSTAQIGQTIVVKSVDDMGKPTEWEAIDPWIITSSTEGSTKKFKLTIDDDGVLSAEELTE